MIIKKLTLTNFRAYTQAEFEFKTGMNLLVGINGVGKTTVLDALRVCLSVIYPYITETKHKKESFENSDIKIGTNYLQVSCDFNFLGTDYNLLIEKYREKYVEYIVENKKTLKNEIKKEILVERPDKEVFTPSINLFTKDFSELLSDPVGIIFSTKRSLITEKAPSKTMAQGGQVAAQADALNVDRYFNLKVFAEWFNVQEKLAEEKPEVLQYIGSLRTAVETFLPNFNNLHLVVNDGTLQFFIDKNGIPLSIYQLSDGERGVLSIVLDIARRITQANPVLTNPLQNGNGVILIDELDLHLHPKWQRTVVENLTRTFPNCQFIATTHSPQIIGEVKPEFITIINNDTYRPASSYGVDSGRILEEVLDTTIRTKEVDDLLSQLYKSLDEEDLQNAKSQIANLIAILGINDPEITRSNTMINFLEEELADETNSKK